MVVLAETPAVVGGEPVNNNIVRRPSLASYEECNPDVSDIVAAYTTAVSSRRPSASTSPKSSPSKLSENAAAE